MKLKYKITILNIGTIIAVLLILGTIMLEIADDYNLQTVKKYLQAQGDYASIVIEKYISNNKRSIFDTPRTMKKNASFLAISLKQTVKCRVQIFDNISIVGDSEDIINSSSLIRDEVSYALNGKSAYYISDDDNRVFYYATPLVVENKYAYAIAFIYDLTEVDNIKNSIKKVFLLIILSSALLCIMISILLSNKITSPIKKLIKTTKQFAKGKFESRAVVTSNDEIGELSNTFNLMAGNIHDMINKLNNEKEKQKHFFDNFTHEIRTPLTTIIGYSDLLWKTDDEEVKDKSLFHISSESKRMLKMIERLLEFSKLKNYNYELQMVESNLKSLIEDVCDSMQYKAKRYNIEFNLDLENINYTVDPDLFKQVVINIIDNSIKYSKSPTIDISLDKSQNIVLTISDYGKGIDPLDLDNIFEPYYKIEKSRNSSTEGWGLGLSFVKEIVTKHNGIIDIHSYPNRGTKVKITL